MSAPSWQPHPSLTYHGETDTIIERHRTYGVPPWHFLRAVAAFVGVGGGLMLWGWPPVWRAWDCVVYAVGFGIASGGGGVIRDYLYARAMRAKGGAK